MITKLVEKSIHDNYLIRIFYYKFEIDNLLLNLSIQVN